MQMHNPYGQQQNPYAPHPAPEPEPVEPVEPVEPEEPEIPEGWYSADMQFRPAGIPYVPAKLHEPTFAICEWSSDLLTNGGKIEFGQLPEHAMQAKGTFNGLNEDPMNTDAVTIRFVLNTWGSLGSPDTCDAVGNEFNPLEEVDEEGMVLEF